MNYYSKVINLTNPKEILEKTRNLKGSELNTNSLTIRTKLYDLRYVPEKMKAPEFLDKFEDLIREYESLPDVPPLSELEKRDAMYKAIEDTVLSVKNAEFLTKTQTGKSLSYEQLKFYIIQDEADNNMGYNARVVFHRNREVSKERCYECDDVGHIHAHCPRSDGKKKCYSCSDFVSDIQEHIKYFRKRGRGPGRGFGRGIVAKGVNRYDRNNSGSNFKAGRGRGLKRRGTEVNNSNENKKMKYDQGGDKPKISNKGRGGKIQAHLAEVKDNYTGNVTSLLSKSNMNVLHVNVDNSECKNLRSEMRSDGIFAKFLAYSAAPENLNTCSVWCIMSC